MEKFTTKDMYGEDRNWSAVETAEDVTEDILEAAVEYADSYFPDGNIEWEYLWDRMEGSIVLEDGTLLSMGEDLSSPALAKIKRYVLKVRRET